LERSTTLMDPDASDEMIDHLVDFFDRTAPSYDSWAGGQHERVAARLVEWASPQKGEQVLDVGTGTGLVAFGNGLISWGEQYLPSGPAALTVSDGASLRNATLNY